MKPGAVAASSRSGGGAVAFSWEQEPGVSKQSPAAAKKQTAGAPRPEFPVSRRTPAATANKKAPAPPPPPPPAAAPAHPHRLRVPPPPGGPGAPGASPPGKSGGGPRSRGVRRRDDPFLAAYLACTGNGGGNGKGTHKVLGWSGLGLGLGFGLGLGLRGFGLSCKTSCGAVEDCVVTLARRIPEVAED